MSSVFDTREESFEKRFAMGEELRFKARARRNKLIGLWAAQLLGHQGDAAKAHADALVEAQVGRDDNERSPANCAASLPAPGSTFPCIACFASSKRRWRRRSRTFKPGADAVPLTPGARAARTRRRPLGRRAA